MSEVRIFVVTQSGRVKPFSAVSNSYGFAFQIWDLISQRHMGERFSSGDNRRFWRLFGDHRSSLSENERLVLGCTYDNVIVERETLPRLLVALDEFRKTYELVNRETFDGVVDALTRAAKRRGILGVCFNQTSVNCDVWRVCSNNRVRYANVLRDREYVEKTWSLGPAVDKVKARVTQ